MATSFSLETLSEVAIRTQTQLLELVGKIGEQNERIKAMEDEIKRLRERCYS